MKLKSAALTSSDAFRSNRQAHLAMLDTIRQAADAAAQGGGADALARHTSRGKMPPRERVANLLDPGSPFLEIGATAAHDMYDGAAPGAGAQRLGHHALRQRLAGRRDGVLQVEDERIRPGRQPARQLAPAVAGHEQEGAQRHQAGFRSCRPDRLQCATSSFRWL